MKRYSFFRVSILAMLPAFLFSCRPGHQPAETVTNIIAADNRGDIEQVMALYADSAILLPSGKENITGKPAIRKNYETIFQNSTLQLSPVIEEEMRSGKLAVIRGTIKGKVSFKTDNSSVTVNDKFLMVLKKETTVWKIQRLMWSKKD